MKANRSVALAALVLTAGIAIRAGADEPKALPRDVTDAWEKAGAMTGWVGRDENGALGFRAGGPGKKGEVPGFRLVRWEAGALAKLPAPAAAFGLDLSSSTASDADMKALAKMKSLDTLNADETQITDAGLKELAGLNQLRVVCLFGARVKDAGMKSLAALPALEELDVRKNAVTNAGFKELAGAKQLRLLYAGNTRLTDAGLKELAGLKQLRELDLVATPITDAGLNALSGLSQLRFLALTDTKVTEAGAAKLKKALPQCEIAR